ncbi:unnamed protein product, partial [Scytosiphon promiscuus]
EQGTAPTTAQFPLLVTKQRKTLQASATSAMQPHAQQHGLYPARYPTPCSSPRADVLDLRGFPASQQHPPHRAAPTSAGPPAAGVSVSAEVGGGQGGGLGYGQHPPGQAGYAPWEGGSLDKQRQ